MSAAARRRAIEVYDWARIIPMYQDLWGELAARRAIDDELAPPNPKAPDPRRADPFLTFRGHGSRIVHGNDRLVLVDGDGLDAVLSLDINTFALEFVGGRALLERIVSTLRTLASETPDRPVTVAGCLAAYGPSDQAAHVRAVLWLDKFGVVSVEDRNT